MKWSGTFIKEWLNPWREYVSEFIGVALFVFLSSSVVVSQSLGETSLLITALGIGLSYVCALYVTGHVSLGFLNPAVVIALWLVNRINSAKALFYLFAQVLGSFVGTVMLWAIFAEQAELSKFGAPMPGLGVGIERLVTAEVIFSAILVFFVFALSVAKTAPTIFGPLVFGFYITVAIIISYPVSGSSLNVVRALGPLTFAGEYQYLITYFISGIVGSLAGLFYEYIFLKKAKSKG